jgi:hypothetical protein
MSLKHKIGFGIVALGLASLVGSCSPTSSPEQNLPKKDSKVYCEISRSTPRNIMLEQNSFGVNQYSVDLFVTPNDSGHRVYRSATGSEVPNIQNGSKFCVTVNPNTVERKKGIEWRLVSYNRRD